MDKIKELEMKLDHLQGKVTMMESQLENKADKSAVDATTTEIEIDGSKLANQINKSI